MPFTDAQLVSQAQAGDFAAFEELVNRHEQRLYRLALRITRNVSDAEDVLQTALMQALESLGDFRGDAAFGTWVTQIATHEALKVLRRRATHPDVSLTPANDDDDQSIPFPEFIADWRDNPLALYEQRELRQILNEAMETLPEKLRAVFALRDIEGLSIDETARVLNLTEANVKVRLLRARLALREYLTQRFGDPLKQIARGHQHKPSRDVTSHQSNS